LLAKNWSAVSPLHVPVAVYRRACARHAAGDVIGAWSVLESAGDAYARIAHHILSDENSYMNAVRAVHWHMTSKHHSTMGDQLWHDISRESLGRYLSLMGSRIFEQDGKQVALLPNTKEIEECYMAGVAAKGEEKASVIHLAANQICTPISKPIENLCRAFSPYAGPLRNMLNHVDMPTDWHEVLGARYGTLGGRQVDNSPNFTNLSYMHNLRIVMCSFMMGTFNFMTGHKPYAPANER